MDHLVVEPSWRSKITSRPITAPELLTKAHKELPPFLARIEEDSHVDALSDLENWADAGVLDVQVKLVPELQDRLGKWYRANYALTGIEGAPDSAFMALSTRALINGFLFEVPLYDFHPKNLGRYELSDFGKMLAQTITAGWQDHAELVARTGFDELNRLMDRGISYGRLGWFMLELARDWLKADVDLRTDFREAEVRSLGVWDEVLANWRERDAHKFDAMMSKAAEHHLAQSRVTEAGGKERYFEFGDLAYWLFPVELLAILRLRQWEGIPTVTPSHPLFAASTLGRLPPDTSLPQLNAMDRAETEFRRHYPATPKLADLHELRREQGGEAI